MVLKRSKHDINSGNTLRDQARHELRRLSTEGTIRTYHSTNVHDEVARVLDAIVTNDPSTSWEQEAFRLCLENLIDVLSFLDSTRIEFSLNKAQNWLLPELLESCILELQSYIKYVPVDICIRLDEFSLPCRLEHRCEVNSEHLRKQTTSSPSTSSRGNRRHFVPKQSLRGVQRLDNLLLNKKRRLKRKFSLNQKKQLKRLKHKFRHRKAKLKNCDFYKKLYGIDQYYASDYKTGAESYWDAYDYWEGEEDDAAASYGSCIDIKVHVVHRGVPAKELSTTGKRFEGRLCGSKSKSMKKCKGSGKRNGLLNISGDSLALRPPVRDQDRKFNKSRLHEDMIVEPSLDLDYCESSWLKKSISQQDIVDSSIRASHGDNNHGNKQRSVINETETETDLYNDVEQPKVSASERKPESIRLPHRRVALWEFIDVLHNSRNYQGQKVKLVKCKKKSCSVAQPSTDTQLSGRNQKGVFKEVECKTAKSSSYSGGGKPILMTSPNVLVTSSMQVINKDSKVSDQQIKVDKQSKMSKDADNIRKQDKSNDKTDNNKLINDVFPPDVKKKPKKRKTRPPVTEKQMIKTLDSVCFKLKQSAASLSYLEKKYRWLYMESNSLPRKIWINVTPFVQDDAVSCSSEGVDFERPSDIDAGLLFTLPETAAKNRQGNTSFFLTRVQIKSHLSQKREAELYKKVQDEVKEQFLYPMSKIIRLFLNAYASFSAVTKPQLHCTPAPALTLTQMDWLYSLQKWNFDIVTAEEAFTAFQTGHQQAGFQTSALPRPGSALSVLSSTQTPSVCDICVQVQDRCQHGKGCLTVLLSCQHVMCESCLKLCLTQSLEKEDAPILCPVSDCSTQLDLVTLVSGVSLSTFKKYLFLLQKLKVKDHPQWQWCPRTDCNRAVKLHGAGILDDAVVIQCICGDIWCFSCQREAHWPASCPDALVYKQLLQRESVSRAYFVLDVSEGHQSRHPAVPKTFITDTVHNLPTTEHQQYDEQYDHQYELCYRCLDVPHSSLQIPNFMKRQKLVEVEGACALLPVLYFRSAMTHRQSRLSWNQAEAESRAAVLARLIHRSTSRSLSLSKGELRPNLIIHQKTTVEKCLAIQHVPFQPLPGNTARVLGGRRHSEVMQSLDRLPSRQHVQVSSSLEIDKLFLIMVQDFIYQAHILLEYIYVVLFCQHSHDTSTPLVKLILKLERIISSMHVILDDLVHSPLSIIGRLRHLVDSGKRCIVAIATLVKVMPSSSLKKMETAPLLPRWSGLKGSFTHSRTHMLKKMHLLNITM